MRLVPGNLLRGRHEVVSRTQTADPKGERELCGFNCFGRGIHLVVEVSCRWNLLPGVVDVLVF